MSKESNRVPIRAIVLGENFCPVCGARLNFFKTKISCAVVALACAADCLQKPGKKLEFEEEIICELANLERFTTKIWLKGVTFYGLQYLQKTFFQKVFGFFIILLRLVSLLKGY